MAVSQLSPAEILGKIRYDQLTKKGSVYDVIQLVTGCQSKHAVTSLQRLSTEFPDVLDNVSMHKFPGQGQRATPVAPLPVLFRVMALAPGSRARKFGSKSMDVFSRAFGGDPSLAEEVRGRGVALAGTSFENSFAGVTTTVDEAMSVLEEPMEPAADEGVVYVATSPFQAFFKLGFWTGSLDALETRYRTYYGPRAEIQTWPCSECRACEAFLLEELASHSMGGEIFSKEAMPAAIELLDTASAM